MSSGIQRRQLANGTEVVWATPLSGFGHVADEQPLPYLQRAGTELSPRFGGEESDSRCNIASLPMPYGRLATPWPWEQRLFNISRRRVNVYWRNVARSMCRDDLMFFFIEQLKYRATESGFAGVCPLLSYRRNFAINHNTVVVVDAITFKRSMRFNHIFLCPWVDFLKNDSSIRCTIEPSLSPNYKKEIKSSTGTSSWNAKKILNPQFEAGQTLVWKYIYRVN
jgi:hypothetical protein